MGLNTTGRIRLSVNPSESVVVRLLCVLGTWGSGFSGNKRSGLVNPDLLVYRTSLNCFVTSEYNKVDEKAEGGRVVRVEWERDRSTRKWISSPFFPLP